MQIGVTDSGLGNVWYRPVHFRKEFGVETVFEKDWVLTPSNVKLLLWSIGKNTISGVRYLRSVKLGRCYRLRSLNAISYTALSLWHRVHDEEVECSELLSADSSPFQPQ